MLTGRHHICGRVARTLSILMTLFALSSLSPGCSSLWKAKEKVVTVTETVTEYRDSTAWRDTTIYVPIPLESDQAIVQVGDTSHRETSVAESDAWVGDDGFLHHELRNKHTSLASQVIFPERYLVSYVKNTRERAEIITKEVKVEKPLNAWQRFRIGAFWWLLALAAVGWRKQLLRLIKKAAGLFG